MESITCSKRTITVVLDAVVDDVLGGGVGSDGAGVVDDGGVADCDVAAAGGGVAFVGGDVVGSGVGK